jgi:alkyl hydroperoxide reductase subunit D
MSIETLKERLARAAPAAAKDLRLNLSGVMTSTALTPRQAWGAALAAALAARNRAVTQAIGADAAAHLSPEEAEAAETAAAVMAMNNVYYRSIHMLPDQEYGRMPARLRMNALARPGVDKIDFELWSLAASAVNGCSMCLAAHEREVREKGLGREAVQDAIRIAAVVHAAAAVLDGAEALGREITQAA